MTRVLIVDDEPMARARMRKLLDAHPDVEVIGEAGDGAGAIQQIQELAPDLVFLDVQMPVCDGLDVAASLPRGAPRVIFCTAFDQYAVDAFELNALDYLLKPVSRSRLAQALEKCRRAVSPDSSPAAESQPRLDPPSRFLGQRSNRFRVVECHDVLYFSSVDGLTQLFTAKSSLWMQPSLTELEERLANGGFFRISRAALVNLQHVREVASLTGGYGQVLLSNGTRLDVSRRKLRPLLDLLGR